MKRHKILAIVLIALTVISVAAFSQGIVRLDEAIEIKADVQIPQAIISLSRKRPEYRPASIDSIKTDYTLSAFALVSELIAPAEEEVQPKKMDDLKAMLAKERF